MASERKLVSVLFADVIGSTALSERLDPERLRSVLDDYFAAMAGVIETWGGTVEKFVGDAIVAVFRGSPPFKKMRAEIPTHRRELGITEPTPTIAWDGRWSAISASGTPPV